jgi:hypothetical protein
MSDGTPYALGRFVENNIGRTYTQIVYASLLNKYPYMRPTDLLLISLGVLAILFGLFADIFHRAPRRFVRICLIVLGIGAISNVLWHWM